MDHDRDGALREAPCARGVSVEERIDTLELDEVIAAAHTADLWIATIDVAGRADELLEPEQTSGRERSLGVRACEVGRGAGAVEVLPDPAGLVVLGGRDEPG